MTYLGSYIFFIFHQLNQLNIERLPQTLYNPSKELNRTIKMLEEALDFEGIDEICGAIENIPDVDFLFDIMHTTSISAPLK
jgi:hypothetical protein